MTTEDNIDTIKEMLLKERGVRVRDALEVIEKRDITFDQLRGPKPPG